MKRALLTALLVAACGTATPSSLPTTTPSPTSRPSGCHGTDGATPGCTPGPLTLPAPGTELAPGRYASDIAGPLISFDVDDGWTTVQQLPGFFDIQDDPGSLDVVAVQWTLATGFDSAEDVAADIEGRANLKISERETVTMNDLTGVRLTVETTDPADSNPVIFRPVLITPPGPISIGSARRLQVDLYTLPDTVLAILVGGSVAQWDRAVQLSGPVLQSVYVAH